MRRAEYPLLREFLYLAIYQPAGERPLPAGVVDGPALRAYIESFGKQDDHCLVADVGGAPVGAVWARVFRGEARGYGTIDADTPELSISLHAQYRGQGMGAALMRAMLALLKEQGYARASLSVQRQNPAARLYARLGFTLVSDTDGDCVMVREL